MAGSILGTRVLRTEDPELLLGNAKYVGDLDLGDQLRMVFVRSEMAHAVITGIDTSAAKTAPGVVAMWTAEDLGLAPFQGMATVHADFARPPLATDRVRFVGECIVAVIADTVTHAQDAADMVVVDYEPLPTAVTMDEAVAEDAPLLFEPHGDNVALTNIDPVNSEIFGDADVIVRGRYVNQRIASPWRRWNRTARPAQSPTTADCWSMARRRCRTCCTACSRARSAPAPTT